MVYLQQPDVLAGNFHKAFRLQLVQATYQGKLLYAEAVGIQKFSLIRCLNELQAEGLVEVSGKDIRLLKVDHFK